MALANSTSAVLSITPQSLVPPWATGSGCRSSGSGCHYTQNRVIYPSDVIDMDHARRLVQFEYEEAEAEDATSLLSAAAATANASAARGWARAAQTGLRPKTPRGLLLRR